MTVVLVHGVPETERVWDLLRADLERDDVVAVSLPGFGRPLPDDFTPTKDGYTDWLIGGVEQQVEEHGGPIDLVGHDWGGGFVLRLVSLRPDLVRTWVTDVAGMADPEFGWHDFARTWQTPDEGEAFMDGWLALPIDARAATFGTDPATVETVQAMAAALDRTMTDSILTLYRSATAVQDDWGPAFADIPKPGMVLVASEDPFLNADCARRAATRAGARITELPGQGHWWMLGDPAGSAALLQDFWGSAG
jgi:pimeloyl-ACP methyl ester carboxylesterase